VQKGNAMKWTEGSIDGVEVRPAVRRADQRGGLSELFRSDQIPSPCLPAMAYLSVTHAGMTRGPHEHRVQTDTFCFMGPGDYRLSLWDNRADSPTFGHKQTLTVGETRPAIVFVPPGVVHGYTNVSGTDAWMINLPNRLFAGPGRKEPVDEIRHEDRAATDFRMDE
jgi:dTDP-4-dehydrorhamnose 3,5-epimerase